MIDVKFTETKDEFILDVGGHAGYADKGQDIVCAAVSILVHTLAACIRENADSLETEPDICLEDGSAHIVCKPNSDSKNYIYTIFGVTLCGFSLLSNNYEKYLKFSLGRG